MKNVISTTKGYLDGLRAKLEKAEAENEKLKKSIGRNVDWVEMDGERVYTSYDQKLRDENNSLKDIIPLAQAAVDAVYRDEGELDALAEGLKALEGEQ
jgi:hypothetical protein